ncbi:sigma-70 family RNA polymerase sigma factor [Stagnimonas aquatica]|uniref:Sigma-70 family RNA polymerase sigma factor n=2 Tax=Stagnimonas aquatica TaxID=2689987 RepID=A0A3N0VGF8_9GAMM|nr:sigma-70 family RNA polymerase sigma factor [Stagnimonas aquatica]ROH91857.1 sigma-70 family RNA polymerase sigma factor [Stagnimonas aquatica]
MDLSSATFDMSLTMPDAANEPQVVTGPARAPALGDDAQDVRAAARGDARAFERLYRRHIGKVYGLCWRLCDGDAAKADQAAQDAFVRAWEKLDSFRGESAFSTWLHRLTVNVVLGEHRLLKRWTSFDQALEDGAAEPGHNPSASLGDRLDVERALARLPKGARAVLVLHDLEGWQHDEIAAATGIAVGTSKAQLHRARKLMKEWLS